MPCNNCIYKTGRFYQKNKYSKALNVFCKRVELRTNRFWDKMNEIEILDQLKSLISLFCETNRPIKISKIIDMTLLNMSRKEYRIYEEKILKCALERSNLSKIEYFI